MQQLHEICCKHFVYIILVHTYECRMVHTYEWYTLCVALEKVELQNVAGGAPPSGILMT